MGGTVRIEGLDQLGVLGMHRRLKQLEGNLQRVGQRQRQ